MTVCRGDPPCTMPPVRHQTPMPLQRGAMSIRLRTVAAFSALLSSARAARVHRNPQRWSTPHAPCRPRRCSAGCTTRSNTEHGPGMSCWRPGRPRRLRRHTGVRVEVFSKISAIDVLVSKGCSVPAHVHRHTIRGLCVLVEREHWKSSLANRRRGSRFQCGASARACLLNPLDQDR